MHHTLAFLLAALMLGACGKGELDADALNDNPFDPLYDGPAVFILDSTYSETIVLPSGLVVYQVVAFHVDESRFLQPADYNVHVADEQNGSSTIIGESQAHSARFQYRRLDPVQGAQLCLRLSLTNNGNNARAERICATL